MKMEDIKRRISLTLMIVLVFSQNAHAEAPHSRFINLYDGLLQTYVSPAKANDIAYEGVDYEGWATDPRHQEALELLLSETPNTYTENNKKAFWINAYNFLTIELIIREEERGSIKNLGGTFTSPWKRHSWALDGQDYTLNTIEHEILRPMDDPRIHFAINCASVSCPDLRAEAYRADKLDIQLEEQTVLALKNTGKGLRIEGDKVYASKIFDWFSEDFNDGDIKGWISPYIALDKNAKIIFMDYDWSLNKPSE